MTTKHTPGPWIAERQSVFAPNETGSAKAIADMCYNVRTIETAKANATLIAAAPDLLEALTKAFIAMGSAGANYNTNHGLRPAWEMARAAIAKAEGR